MVEVVETAGGQFGPMGGKIDPSFMTGLEIAERKTEESTMYRTAAGGSLPAGSAFSTHAMLAQLGRLPLETIRAMTGIVIADALSIAFEWYKEDGGKYKGYNARKKTQIELNSADIPESVMIECILDINLPQDKLQQAGIFNALWDKLPPDYLVETVLGEGQYDDMLAKLWSYQAANAHFGAYMQAQMAQAQQAAMQPPPQQQQPPMMQGAPPQQEEMSLPPGIPVEQLQMGAQPPEAPMMEGEMPA